MPKAEFEEKQYETAANIELGLQHAAVFAAGQVLEAVVGYDTATAPPQNAPIWELIGVKAPTGLQLVPNLWQRARVKPKAPQLPSRYVSLILQYKRPEYLNSNLAAQWSHWKRAYYRFLIRQRQQNILVHLENSVSARAVLRYACPVFWKYEDLQKYQHSQSILSQSTFVTASKLVGHKAWTYRVPGSIGFANPTNENIPTNDFNELWRILETNAKKENLFQHLSSLSAELRNAPLLPERFLAPGWLTRFNSLSPLTQKQYQAVLNTLELAEYFGQAGASWFVIDLNIQNP